ncbi:MAG: branched-chain amino acid ABC transporter permease [Spirochaetes bacterium]|nr:branched-chain amino acid ABC transporter permease [Spirochaetota bacterium]
MNSKKLNKFLTDKFGDKIGNLFNEIILSFITSLWFMILMFPIMIIKVNTIDQTIIWRWHNLIYIGAGSFVLSYLWRKALKLKEMKSRTEENSKKSFSLSESLSNLSESKFHYPAMGVTLLLFILIPVFSSLYQTTVLSSALIYVMLGLGLNIVVGLGGLLNLGYVAFYIVGAYSYAMLNTHFGLSFWVALPIGALLSTVFGILLALPILRLRGDYLAIVTLAFAEIIRLILQNEGDIFGGPSGINNIEPPSFFGFEFGLDGKTVLMYYIILFMTIFTIFVIFRLENSRIGRAWQALREDEIATKSMGINVTMTKLTSFALGATWAGFAGVLFSAKTAFINPDSFTIWESVIILCFVVLGGMGSIFGVAIAALILYILPESLRAFAQYRMLVYGISLVLMMIFRQGGIIDVKRKHYKLPDNIKAD